MRLYLTALKPTDSVTDGFLPAARALGCEVTILTDRPERHSRPETSETSEVPMASRVEVLHCDVRDARAVVDTIAHHHPPDAIFSNSDHIQAETALAAAYFGLPGKDWRACVDAKNKALTRRRLAAAGVESVRSVRLAPGDPPPRDLPFPVVVKPREGVASEDVVLVGDADELARTVRAIRDRRPGEALVVEEYLDGPLHTMETLGDGERIHVLGGFRTTLGPPPYFVEERLDWEGDPPGRDHVLRALRALGAGFGACHTEYVMTAAGPRIIEVNYRVIGDHCDFLLADLLDVPLFELILGVHLGSAADAPGPAKGHGTALSLVAGRSGTVVAAPGAVDPSPGEPARLWHRPLRAVGDRVDLSHTNRDYLGVVRAVGPDRAGVDAAIAAFTAGNPWVIA